MKPLNADPNEQAFIEQALAAAARAQRWDQVRVIVATGAAVSAAVWFAFRPPSPELGVEATIIIVIGAMIAAATAKVRSLIQRNTNLVLQALAALRPHADSPRSEEH
jgi:hypothetical protein